MIDEKKRRKKSKKPSAMAQVHNRVNAGVMDGVCYGGMMEAAEPEDEEYVIGGEEDAPVGGEYYHVNESTDCVKFSGYYLECYDEDAVPFISLFRKDGSSGPIFVGPQGGLHGNFKFSLYGDGIITPDEYGKPSELKVDEKRTGRFWSKEDAKVISFYSYSDSVKRIYNNCIEALQTIQKETGEYFNIGEVMVDLWTQNPRNPVIMPVRWFNNGMAEIFLPITSKCEPYESFDGSFRYRVYTTKGVFDTDWTGDDMEEPQSYDSLSESKHRIIKLNEKDLCEMIKKVLKSVANKKTK